ncbi:MAG: carbon-nitrogen hydrolase family protein [Thermomicrobiales bacterium]
MRVGFVEWPEGLDPNSPEWRDIADSVAGARVDLLITNELPFGPWIAEHQPFDRVAAEVSVAAHAAGLAALRALAAPAILTSRPVWGRDRLLNQAVLLDTGRETVVHTKQYFPEEPGWFEASWYEPGPVAFQPADVAGLRLGVLLCTDAMFNEHARRYGREGASLIALPRAAGTKTENWLLAGRMAALVSGCYVVSSNRSGRAPDGTEFGGAGFAVAPDGTVLTMTAASTPLRVVEVQPELAARQRKAYPCYVVDRSA